MKNRTVARFEKVSFEQFKKDCEVLGILKHITKERLKEGWEDIKLPKRATKGSAGYDFYMPLNLSLKCGETEVIPTGIRVEMKQDYVLKLYPKSGLGFKFKMQLNNSVGVVDSDFFYSDNEGHIMAKITNDNRESKTLNLEEGKGFIQGVFVEYFLAEEEEVERIRNGGFGSTEERE